MFVRQNQQQFRNSNADVQIFYGSAGGNGAQRTWNKPPGVSHIYMMCIGAGGPGDGAGTGGGSGAVTVWYGAAQNVPDSLIASPSFSGAGVSSYIAARFTGTAFSGTTLITANSAASITGATAMTATQFTASGFFQSIAGQNGTAGSTSASPTTFLSGGSAGAVVSNYGYSTSSDGFFQMQPIIVGVGGQSGYVGGIGCGGGATSAPGGPGMVLIASW